MYSMHVQHHSCRAIRLHTGAARGLRCSNATCVTTSKASQAVLICAFIQLAFPPARSCADGSISCCLIGHISALSLAGIGAVCQPFGALKWNGATFNACSRLQQCMVAWMHLKTITSNACLLQTGRATVLAPLCLSTALRTKSVASCVPTPANYPRLQAS
jgi:hypothetical protein